MKKKILFILGTIAIAFVLTINFSVTKISKSSGLELKVLNGAVNAQAAVKPGIVCGFYEYTFRCYCYDTGYLCGGGSPCGQGSAYCDL
jgi:hypothetical protein